MLQRLLHLCFADHLDVNFGRLVWSLLAFPRLDSMPRRFVVIVLLVFCDLIVGQPCVREPARLDPVAKVRSGELIVEERPMLVTEGVDAVYVALRVSSCGQQSPKFSYRRACSGRSTSHTPPASFPPTPA